MNAPPTRLDNAVVLYFVVLEARHRQVGGTRLFVEGTAAPRPEALAIGQCAGEDSVYLLYCRADWEVITDDLCDSVPEAFLLAGQQFEGLTEAAWTVVHDSAEQLAVAANEEAARIAALPDDYASEETLRRLVQEGEGIEAITRHRLVTGQSLAEAYQYVQSLKQKSGD